MNARLNAAWRRVAPAGRRGRARCRCDLRGEPAGERADVLTVTGDSANNMIVISRTAAGTILLNGGAIGFFGFLNAAPAAATLIVRELLLRH